MSLKLGCPSPLGFSIALGLDQLQPFLDQRRSRRRTTQGAVAPIPANHDPSNNGRQWQGWLTRPAGTELVVVGAVFFQGDHQPWPARSLKSTEIQACPHGSISWSWFAGRERRQGDLVLQSACRQPQGFVTAAEAGAPGAFSPGRAGSRAGPSLDRLGVADQPVLRRRQHPGHHRLPRSTRASMEAAVGVGADLGYRPNADDRHQQGRRSRRSRGARHHQLGVVGAKSGFSLAEEDLRKHGEAGDRRPESPRHAPGPAIRCGKLRGRPRWCAKPTKHISSETKPLMPVGQPEASEQTVQGRTILRIFLAHAAHLTSCKVWVPGRRWRPPGRREAGPIKAG